MSLTTDELQGFLDALDRMVASGVLRTTYEGRTVEYRSMSDLMMARASIARQLTAAQGASVPRHVNPVFSRGLRP